MVRVRPKSIWQMLVQAGNQFLEDNVISLAGALAFFTALSIAPLLLILLYFAGLMGADTQNQIVNLISDLVGSQASEGLDIVIENARSNASTGSLAGLLGIATLLLSATGVFAQLQHSLNIIWGVKLRDATAVQTAKTFLYKRLMSLLLMLLIGVLLFASITVSTTLAALFKESGGSLWTVLDLIIPWVLFTLVFAILFKYLPDAETAWRDIWVGASLTALLFSLGKIGIGMYLGRSTVASSYGAAGSLIVLLLWFYYSALIFYFGAELTQAYASRFGHDVVPAPHAERRVG